MTISKLAKEIEKVCKENDATLKELYSFLEQGKILFPRIGDILEKIINIAKSHSDKKV
jgi:hypothetical protein